MKIYFIFQKVYLMKGVGKLNYKKYASFWILDLDTMVLC